jgi:hypothetical protein
MKAFSLSLVLAVLALTLNPAAKADVISATLMTGLSTDGLVQSSILNGEQFTYTHTTLGLLSGGVVLSSSTSVFTATYVDVLGTLGVLNITDVCTNLTLIGKPTPCQDFAFSFTDVTLPIANVIVPFAASVNLTVGIADVDLAGVSVGATSGEIDFTGPPTPPTSATPEPSSLCLMATGLLTAAGAVRRRFTAAAAAPVAV